MDTLHSTPSPSPQKTAPPHTNTAAEAAVPTRPFNWFVALDADGDCRGAIAFAKWLADGNSGAHHFIGVHVPPEPGVDALQSEARAHAVVRSAGAEKLFDDILRTQANAAPSEVLTELDSLLAAGLIVARRADADGPELIRLGGTVRQIAEHASIPAAIVPHDFERDTLGRGPIVLAVDPEHTPGSVARFVAALVRRNALELVLTTVARVEHVGVLAASTDALAKIYADAERRTAEALTAWAMKHGLATARREVVRGDVRHAVQTVAQRHDASIIVCGTRQRSIFHRLLEPSRALELARFARRPVLLVPETEVPVGD